MLIPEDLLPALGMGWGAARLMHSQEEKPEWNGNTLVVHCRLSPGLLEDKEDPGPGIPDRASGRGVHRAPLEGTGVVDWWGRGIYWN